MNKHKVLGILRTLRLIWVGIALAAVGVFADVASALACGESQIGEPSHWVWGQVAAIDSMRQTVTIAHGVIDRLELPKMTMIYSANSPLAFQSALTCGLAVGKSVRFLPDVSADRRRYFYIWIDVH